jgi:outer membrane protein assembly factor BamA
VVVRNFLDSLGYFSALWDTLGPGQFQVVPAQRALIITESFIGAPSGTIDSLQNFNLPVKYNAAIITQRTAEIGRRLAECGYPFARVTVTISSFHNGARTPTRVCDSVIIIYRIDPDRKCLFASPRLIGSLKTNRAMLLRDIKVRKGDIFDIRKIEASGEALRQRNYIDDAAIGTIAVEPEAFRDKSDTTVVSNAEYVSVPILLRDRTGLSMDGALGFSSRQDDDLLLQGDLKISLLNMFHRGEDASLLYAGDKTYQKFHCGIVKPWLLGFPCDGSAAFGLEIHERAYGFLEGETRLTVKVGDRWSTGLGMEGTETTLDSVSQSWHYAGVYLIMSTVDCNLHRGLFGTELKLDAGGGIAGRDRSYTRSHVDFNAGLHIPLFRNQAVRLRVATMHLITDESTLVDAEMYRVGGYRTIRGYGENEFAFRTVAWDQLELLHYFSAKGSAYIFLDDGFGFTGSFSRVEWGQRTELLGYGIGVRIPAKLGMLTLEWARNMQDIKSLGRINVQVGNNRSATFGKP